MICSLLVVIFILLVLILILLIVIFILLVVIYVPYLMYNVMIALSIVYLYDQVLCKLEKVHVCSVYSQGYQPIPYHSNSYN